MSVEGIDTETGREGQWSGRITDYKMSAAGEPDFSVTLPQVASFTLEVGDTTYSVGGWDATMEDIAAYGLEVDRSP